MKKVVIAGGGVLGSQIAFQAAYCGFDVTIWLRSQGSIGRTQPKIDGLRKTYTEAIGLMESSSEAANWCRGIADADGFDAKKCLEQVEKAYSGLKLELDMAKAAADADFIIESVAENVKDKIAFYEALAPLMPEKTILCTNSSTLLPSTFAKYTGRPDKYLSLHFANAIWKNNTAEVMGHPGTDPEIYKQTVAFADEINMIPLQLHKEQPGYILNSMLVPFLSAAQALLATGVADFETIDKTWELATGAPAGPFKILDIVGLETAYNINQMKPDAQTEGTVSNLIGKLLKEKIDRGETGVNNGIGFYDYRK